MTSSKDDSAEPSIVVGEYETLRRGAVGDALPPEARSGLMVFLRLGMWGWARALTTRSAFLQPIGSQPSNWKAPEEHRTIIHIFASMAIRANN